MSTFGYKPEEKGPPRITKKFLLDHCKKHKLYQTPHLNDVLYLHYQGFYDIEGLDEYVGLKCLWLECNAISEIKGINTQENLKCLYLQHNLIKKINNLECCSELDSLNLSYNHIMRIENCGKDVLPVLSTLNLAHNHLRLYENLANLEFCENLSVLDLSHNRIEDILVVKIFAKMPSLRVLVLEGNPVVSNIPQYRKTMILECKILTYLDSRPVFPKDRACAEAWKRGGYEEERREIQRWNKRDRKKMRDSVNATLRLRQRHKGEGDTDTTLLPTSSDESDVESQSRTNTANVNQSDMIATERLMVKDDLIAPIVNLEIPKDEEITCIVCHRQGCSLEHIKRKPRKLPSEFYIQPEDYMEDFSEIFNINITIEPEFTEKDDGVLEESESETQPEMNSLEDKDKNDNSKKTIEHQQNDTISQTDIDDIVDYIDKINADESNDSESTIMQELAKEFLAHGSETIKNYEQLKSEDEHFETQTVDRSSNESENKDVQKDNSNVNSDKECDKNSDEDSDKEFDKDSSKGSDEDSEKESEDESKSESDKDSAEESAKKLSDKESVEQSDEETDKESDSLDVLKSPKNTIREFLDAYDNFLDSIVEKNRKMLETPDIVPDILVMKTPNLSGKDEELHETAENENVLSDCLEVENKSGDNDFDYTKEKVLENDPSNGTSADSFMENILRQIITDKVENDVLRETKDTSTLAEKVLNVECNESSKSDLIKSLLANPFTKEMSQTSDVELNEMVEKIKEENFENVSGIVQRVYDKKDRYDDDLELIDDKLVIIERTNAESTNIIDLSKEHLSPKNSTKQLNQDKATNTKFNDLSKVVFTETLTDEKHFNYFNCDGIEGRGNSPNASTQTSEKIFEDNVLSEQKKSDKFSTKTIEIISCQNAFKESNESEQISKPTLIQIQKKNIEIVERIETTQENSKTSENIVANISLNLTCEKETKKEISKELDLRTPTSITTSNLFEKISTKNTKEVLKGRFRITELNEPMQVITHVFETGLKLLSDNTLNTQPKNKIEAKDLDKSMLGFVQISEPILTPKAEITEPSCSKENFPESTDAVLEIKVNTKNDLKQPLIQSLQIIQEPLNNITANEVSKNNSNIHEISSIENCESNLPNLNDITIDEALDTNIIIPELDETMQANLNSETDNVSLSGTTAEADFDKYDNILELVESARASTQISKAVIESVKDITAGTLMENRVNIKELVESMQASTQIVESSFEPKVGTMDPNSSRHFMNIDTVSENKSFITGESMEVLAQSSEMIPEPTNVVTLDMVSNNEVTSNKIELNDSVEGNIQISEISFVTKVGTIEPNISTEVKNIHAISENKSYFADESLASSPQSSEMISEPLNVDTHNKDNKIELNDSVKSIIQISEPSFMPIVEVIEPNTCKENSAIITDTVSENKPNISDHSVESLTQSPEMISDPINVITPEIVTENEVNITELDESVNASIRISEEILEPQLEISELSGSKINTTIPENEFIMGVDELTEVEIREPDECEKVGHIASASVLDKTVATELDNSALDFNQISEINLEPKSRDTVEKVLEERVNNTMQTSKSDPDTFNAFSEHNSEYIESNGMDLNQSEVILSFTNKTDFENDNEKNKPNKTVVDVSPIVEIIPTKISPESKSNICYNKKSELVVDDDCSSDEEVLTLHTPNLSTESCRDSSPEVFFDSQEFNSTISDEELEVEYHESDTNISVIHSNSKLKQFVNDFYNDPIELFYSLDPNVEKVHQEIDDKFGNELSAAFDSFSKNNDSESSNSGTDIETKEPPSFTDCPQLRQLRKYLGQDRDENEIMEEKNNTLLKLVKNNLGFLLNHERPEARQLTKKILKDLNQESLNPDECDDESIEVTPPHCELK